MSEERRRRWLVPAVAVLAAALLLGLLRGDPARGWHLVLVDVSGPASTTPEALPRLTGLEQAGTRLAWPGVLPDRDALEELADLLADRGWRVVSFTDAAGSSSRAVTEAVLQSTWSGGPARGRAAVLVRYRPSGGAELDRELGRLIDGMASPLPPARTLYVVIDRGDRSVTLAGPRAFRPGSVPPAVDFTSWLLEILAVPTG